MLAWIRGREGEMTAERRAHAEQWARSLSIVYIRTCAEFNCACVLLRAQAIQRSLVVQSIFQGKIA